MSGSGLAQGQRGLEQGGAWWALAGVSRESECLNFLRETVAKTTFDPWYNSSPTVFPNSHLELCAAVRVICSCTTHFCIWCTFSLSALGRAVCDG